MNRIVIEHLHGIKIPAFREQEHVWFLDILGAEEGSQAQDDACSAFNDLISWLETLNGASAAFSCEHLCAQTPKAILKLKEILEPYFSNFKIIIYFRDPLKAALSWWATQLVGSLDYVSLNEEYGLPDPRPGASIFELFDPKAIISKWEAVFPDCLDIGIYDRLLSHKDELILDFLARLSISDIACFEMPERENKSLSFDALRLLHFLDSHPLLKAGTPGGQLFERMRSRYVTILGSVCDSGSGYSPSPEELDIFYQSFSSGIEFLAKYVGFDIVEQWGCQRPAWACSNRRRKSLMLSDDEIIVAEFVVQTILSSPAVNDVIVDRVRDIAILLSEGHPLEPDHLVQIWRLLAFCRPDGPLIRSKLVESESPGFAIGVASSVVRSSLHTNKDREVLKSVSAKIKALRALG